MTPDRNKQLFLRQVDNFLLACNSEQAAKDIFKAIGKAIQFDAENRDKIIPFVFLGVVKDYNGVDIKQFKDYIEMSCANYIQRLLKLHGWDKDSSKPLPSDPLSIPALNTGSDNVDTSNGVATTSVSVNSAVASVAESVFVENVTRNVCDINSTAGIGNGIRKVPEHFLKEEPLPRNFESRNFYDHKSSHELNPVSIKSLIKIQRLVQINLMESMINLIKN